MILADDIYIRNLDIPRDMSYTSRRLLGRHESSQTNQYLIKAHATSWGENEYTLGSYSSAKPGKAYLREVLKSSVGDRIYFAGEATSINYGTVHGADLSGKRAVEDFLKTLEQ